MMFLEKVATLAHSIRTCNRCSIRKEARRPVIWDGPYDTHLMIVGRNPGRQENEQGVPFYPEAPGGRTLMQALKSAGLTRRNFIITNLVKCYTTEDRPPEDDPKEICFRQHLMCEILLFKPQMILALGNDAFRILVDTEGSVTRCRQQWYTRMYSNSNGESHSTLVMGTWHPGSAVRHARANNEMRADICWLANQLTIPPSTS